MNKDDKRRIRTQAQQLKLLESELRRKDKALARLPGRPDIVYPKRRVAIFVDGCFWHGCPEHGVSPKKNADFWKAKLDGNKTRDEKVNAELSVIGWTVIRIWEHGIKSDVEAAADRVQSVINAVES